MSSFTTPLIYEEVGVQQWRIAEPFIFWEGSINTGIPIFVPKDFVTDGASIPQLFWNIMPPVGARYSKAAIIHDFLYTTHRFPKKRADKIFLEGMKVLGVSWWKRTMMYNAVKYGGKKAWEGKNLAVALQYSNYAKQEEIKYFRQQEALKVQQEILKPHEQDAETKTDVG